MVWPSYLLLEHLPVDLRILLEIWDWTWWVLQLVISPDCLSDLLEQASRGFCTRSKYCHPTFFLGICWWLCWEWGMELGQLGGDLKKFLHQRTIRWSWTEPELKDTKIWQNVLCRFGFDELSSWYTAEQSLLPNGGESGVVPISGPARS